VWGDNTVAVFYIITREVCTACKQNSKTDFLWAQKKFLPLRAVYIPGHLDVGVDLQSRQK